MISAARRRIMTLHAGLPPVVAVIGTTGVGKSQLSVSLAQSLARRPVSLGAGIHDVSSSSTNAPGRSVQRALVLSADSMQVYKGLDVITNKITKEEMGGVEHWGLDMIQPGVHRSWDVGKWCLEAGQEIDALPPDTLPIVCGGTHVWVQHFLFPPPEMSFARPSSPKSEGKLPAAAKPDLRWVPRCPRPPIPEGLSSEMDRLLDTFWQAEPEWPASATSTNGDAATAETEAGPSKTTRPTVTDTAKLYALHQLLTALDPAEAGRWSWRDGRKVRRSLERWWEAGAEIAQAEGPVGDAETGGRAGRKARYRTLMFWVYEPLEQLKSRLDGRVDKMVENGLLREIVELRQIAEQMYGSLDQIDFAEGIFQAIGFKEFHDCALPGTAETATNAGYRAGLSMTKERTSRYARRQMKWIQRQLLPVIREAKVLGGDVELYVLRGGGTDDALAADILRAFLAGETLPGPCTVGHPAATSLLQMLDQAPVPVPDTADRQTLNAHKLCQSCSHPNEPFVVIQSQWDQHVASKQHLSSIGELEQRRAEIIAAQKSRQAEVRAQREASKAAVATSRAAEAPPDEHAP